MTATEARERHPETRVPAGSDAEDEARACAYSVLGALLARAPQAELLAQLAALDLVEGDAGELARAWQALREAAGSADSSALGAEFHALFIGLGRGELVPYGSYYLTGFLMERPLAELRTDLARLGFTRAEDVSEPEDHAAALAEVMAALVAGEDAVDLDTQRQFFDTHLAPWMGRFFQDMQQAEAASFYATVGAFGAAFVALEQAAFEMSG